MSSFVTANDETEERNENKDRGNSGDSDVEDEDASFEVRQLPVPKHEMEETNLE